MAVVRINGKNKKIPDNQVDAVMQRYPKAILDPVVIEIDKNKKFIPGKMKDSVLAKYPTARILGSKEISNQDSMSTDWGLGQINDKTWDGLSNEVFGKSVKDVTEIENQVKLISTIAKGGTKDNFNPEGWNTWTTVKQGKDKEFVDMIQAEGFDTVAQKYNIGSDTINAINSEFENDDDKSKALAVILAESKGDSTAINVNYKNKTNVEDKPMLDYNDPKLNEISKQYEDSINYRPKMWDVISASKDADIFTDNAVVESTRVNIQKQIDEISIINKNDGTMKKQPAPALEVWNEEVDAFNSAIYSVADNFILGKSGEGVLQPIVDYFGRFRDPEANTEDEFLINVAEGLAKLPAYAGLFGRDIVEGGFGTATFNMYGDAAKAKHIIEFIAKDNILMLNDLLTAASMNPLVQARRAMGSEEAEKEYQETVKRVNTMPVEYMMSPMILKQTIAAGKQVPRMIKKVKETVPEAIKGVKEKAKGFEETLTKMKEQKLPDQKPDTKILIEEPIVKGNLKAKPEITPEQAKRVEFVEPKQETVLIENVKTNNKKTADQILEAVESAKDSKEPLPKFAGSINLTKQQIKKRAKQLEVELAKLNPKKSQSWKDAQKFADKVQGDIIAYNKLLRKAKKQGVLNAKETLALRQIVAGGMARFQELSKMKVDGKVKKEFELIYNDMFKVMTDVTSEAGRALNIYKKDVGPVGLANSFAKLGRELNPREMAEFRALDFTDPIAVKKFQNRLGNPKIMDYVNEYWYNSILSGVPTHLINAGSNTLWSMYQGPHRALTGALDGMISKFTGKEQKVFMNEIVPYFAGLGKGFKRGLKRGKETIKTGETPADISVKWDTDVGANAGTAWSRSPYKWMRDIGPAINAPTTGLRAMDVVANTAAFDAHLSTLARRSSNKKGLKGKERTEFETNFKKKPPEEAILEAQEFARHATFMDNPGKFSEWLIQGQKVSPAVRYVVPFVRTIGNLTKRGIEMTPGLGLVRMPKYYKKTGAPEILAKQIEGAALAMYIIYKMDAGEITGNAPENKAEREAMYRRGVKPWSIKVGNNWVEYRRLEPFGTVIGSVATFKKSYDENQFSTMKEFAAGASNVTNDMVDFWLESSYLRGLRDVLGKSKSRQKQTGEAFARATTAVVPYSNFWRSINRSVEALAEGDAKLREQKTFLDAWSQVIPNFLLPGEKPKAKLNVWGDEIVLEGGMLRQFLPIKYQSEKNDPLENELERIGYYPALPSKKITIDGEKVELPDDFYRDYAINYGHQAKKELDLLVPQLKNLDPESARDLLVSRLNNTRKIHTIKMKIEYRKLKNK